MKRPFKKMDSSQRPVLFNGLEAVCWELTMSNGLTPSQIQVRNISPGQLYTVIFVQDAKGGHTFGWPDVFKNATPINPYPLAKTVQNLIGDTSGFLLAVPTGAW